jgi:prophage regulatory protein
MNDYLPRVITRCELRRLVPYAPQHILRLERQGEFPKRIKLVEGRVGWQSHEINAWLDQKGRKGGDTVAVRIRKRLRQVLTLFLSKLGFLNNSGHKI